MRLWACFVFLWTLRVTLLLTALAQLMSSSYADGTCNDDLCYSRYNKTLPCQCNFACNHHNNCCSDYLSCNNVSSCESRCSSEYVRTDRCHCDGRCLKKRNCCFDYIELCTEQKTTNTPDIQSIEEHTSSNLHRGSQSVTGVHIIVIIMVVVAVTITVTVAVLLLRRGGMCAGTRVASYINGKNGGLSPDDTYYASVKENTYANQEEGFESNVAYQSYDEGK